MQSNKVFIIKNESPQYLYQGPRFARLGLNSGEEFREKYLIPWLDRLSSNDEGIVDFEDTKTFSPSFLEEAFGGAVRRGYGPKVERLKFINIEPNDWKDDISLYIDNALKRT
jgi:hypothetical protein